MSTAFFKFSIIFLSILFTSSFLSKYIYNKKFSKDYKTVFELSPNIFNILIFILIYSLIFYLNYKLLMVKYLLNINFSLCWLFIICFINGYDKITESFVILDNGIAFKSVFLGIHKDTIVHFRDIENWYFSPKKPNLLIICCTLDNVPLERIIYIPCSKVEKLKETLSIFIRPRNTITLPITLNN